MPTVSQEPQEISGLHTLQVPGELASLARLQRFVEETAAALGIDTGILFDLMLAVDESVTNIIIHGYSSEPGPVTVEMWREGDAVLIRLRDRAPLFDPTRVPGPDLSVPLEERDLGGLGIFLVRRLMDEVTYRVTPDGANELTLRKVVG